MSIESGVSQRSSKMIYQTLWKIKYICDLRDGIRDFFAKILNFQKLLKMALIRKNMKKKFIEIVMERELTDLVIAYQKPQLFPKKNKIQLLEIQTKLQRIQVSHVYHMRLRQLITAYMEH